MNNISVKLMGGMCNYIFQIACTYAYSLKHNKKCIFTTDDSVVVHRHINNYKNNILKNVDFLNSYNFKNFKIFQENGFHYTEIPYIEGDVYLSGYFQSHKYFSDYEKEIKELFSYPIEMVDQMKLKFKDLLSKESCSIHVRRGDYVKQPQYHPVQSMNYYMKSIKKIGIDKTFLVFSDDIIWCKENFPKLDNFHFIEGQKDYEDFLLMTLCNHNIIANSSFSWWSAFLNKNNNSKIIIPKQWFGEAYSNWDTKDLYLKNWEKV